jgi:putative oxidoreductase
VESAEPREFHAVRPSSKVTAALTGLGLLAAVGWAVFGPASSHAALAFMIAWLALSVVVSLALTPRNFTAGFLVGLLTMLVGWRIAGLDRFAWPAFALIPAFLAFVAQFFDRARAGLAANSGRGFADWQLTLLRIYIAFDMVPHFTEKLFAGAAPFMDDAKGFAGFGLAAPAAFVIVGGLCEPAATSAWASSGRPTAAAGSIRS